MASDKVYRWEIYLLREEAHRLGDVEAPDIDTAIKAAIKKFKITGPSQRKLYGQRLDD